MGSLGVTKSGTGFSESEQGGISGTPFYKVSDMNILGNNVYMTNANNYVTDEQISNKKWNPIVPKNQGVLFAKVGAAIFLNRKRLVNEPFLIDNNMMAYLFDDSWNSYFGKIVFEKQNLHQFAQVGALPSYNASDIETIKVSVPLIEEQQLVGNLIKYVDQLIAANQKKDEKLQELKKLLLQKMFVSGDDEAPEIRFNGFTDSWVQYKLSDIADEVKGNDGNIDLPVLTISAAKGWMNQTDRFSNIIAGNELKKYTLLKKGQLSYNHGNSKLAKYGTVFSLEMYDKALVPRVYHSFKLKNTNSKFIEYLFSTKIPDRELRKLISSGARMDGLLNITQSDFMGIPIQLGSNVEQENISRLLIVLDDMITANQKKVENLQSMKKMLLQRMFV